MKDFTFYYYICGAILILFVVIACAYFYIRKYTKIEGKWCKKFEEYYENKMLRRKGYYDKNGQKIGQECIYYPSGEINKIQHWKNGVRDGEFTVFFKNGSVYINGVYQGGKISHQEIYE